MPDDVSEPSGVDEDCRLILAWMDKEFPATAYPSEHWSKGDAAEYLPPDSGISAASAHDPIEMFVKRTAPPPAPCKELAVVRQALVAYGARMILAALRSQGVARRLRKVPAERLLLDRYLIVRPWGRSSTGEEEALMDPRD